MEARLEVGTEDAHEELIEEAEGGCEAAHPAHEFLLCSINLNEDLKNRLRYAPLALALKDQYQKAGIASHGSAL